MNDFLIIGGGIAGLSAGAALSALGSVTVLEGEDTTGYHASGRSAALFIPGYGTGAVLALNRASAGWLESADGGYLGPCGMLVVARAQDEDLFRQDAAAMALERVTAQEAVQKVPILNPARITFAGYSAEVWDIDTDRMMQNLARDLRKSGGKVLTGARADTISRTAGGWNVRAGDRAYQARILVNAAGAWADEIAELAGVTPLGIEPRRRSVAQLPAPGGHDVDGWPVVDGAGERWYAKPQAGKLLVSPADADVVQPQDAWADDMVLAEGLARYEDMMTEPVTRVETSWAGLRSFAPDGVPVLGPDPACPDFLWCAGQGGYGFQTAPAASRLLADIVAGRAPELDAADMAALSPERLRT